MGKERDMKRTSQVYLASAVAKGNTTLVALVLGDNHIGVRGAGAFTAELRHLTAQRITKHMNSYIRKFTLAHMNSYQKNIHLTIWAKNAT